MEEEVLNLADTKGKHFLGVARIELQKLDFTYALSKSHREESEKVISRLLNVFKLEDCRRFDEGNFIDAVVNDTDFDIALKLSGSSRDSFKNTSLEAILKPELIPTLQVPQNIYCLTGLHRIRAAKKYLDNNDQWWIVRLHNSQGLLNNADISTRLLESHSHEQLYSDGTIFRMIRKYHRDGRPSDENRWWARLTDTKRKDLKQLLKNKKLTEAFDGLLEFPGLWAPIQLGKLHRLHALKCSEELINYLNHINVVWSSIVPKNLRYLVDTSTVRNLELHAPAVSLNDAAEINKMMEDNLLFPGMTSDEDRSNVSRSISSIDRLIPSLRTFFENQKYIEPCCLILRKLLDDSEKEKDRSLWRGFSANFVAPEICRVQYTEKSSKSLVLSSPHQKELGYLQLWMFCLRNFPEMTSIKPLIGKKGIRIQWQQNPALWQKLGILAVQLGFQTIEAVRLASCNPDREQVRLFLEVARPHCSNLDSSIDEVAQVLSGIEEHTPSRTDAVLSSELTLSRDRRCGKPHEDDFQSDRSALFVSLFSKKIEPGFDITSLYVKRDILEGFMQSYTSKVDLLSLGTIDDTSLPLEASQPVRQFTSSKSVIQRLEEELSSEKSRVNDFQNENRRLHDDLLALQELLNNVPEDDEYASDILGDHANSSMNETNDLQLEFNRLQDEFNKTQETSNYIRIEKDNLATRLQRINAALKSSEEKCSTFEAKIEELEKERTSRRQADLKSDSTSSEKRRKELESQSLKMSKELAFTKLELASSEVKLKALNDEKLVLEENQNETIKRRNEELRKYTEKLLASETDAREAKKKLEEGQRAAETAQKEHINELQGREKKLREMEDQCKTLQIDNENLVGKIQTLETTAAKHIFRWPGKFTDYPNDPVQAALDYFSQQSARQQDRDMWTITNSSDQEKDHVNVFIIDGPESDTDRIDYRSMQYCIPTTGDIFDMFGKRIQAHTLTAYTIQRITSITSNSPPTIRAKKKLRIAGQPYESNNEQSPLLVAPSTVEASTPTPTFQQSHSVVMKRITDANPLIPACKTGICYLGTEKTMQLLAQRLSDVYRMSKKRYEGNDEAKGREDQGPKKPRFEEIEQRPEKNEQRPRKKAGLPPGRDLQYLLDEDQDKRQRISHVQVSVPSEVPMPMVIPTSETFSMVKEVEQLPSTAPVSVSLSEIEAFADRVNGIKNLDSEMNGKPN